MNNNNELSFDKSNNKSDASIDFNDEACLTVEAESRIENDFKQLEYDLNPSSNKHQIYTSSFKHHVKLVYESKLYTNTQITKIFNIPIRSLYRWIKSGFIRKKGSGRKISSVSFETKLLSWYNKQRQNNINNKVTTTEFKNKSKEIYMEESRINQFKASYGWMRKFIKRNNIILD